ncbi:MAG: RsmB/NOP family class I SAM-dependent RNA methyltransferase [Firmicutes bacterium]|nr:RsmB/NOP family class I SAM-dependent RNA methyltransferase [Bacillota bacterium]
MKMNNLKEKLKEYYDNYEEIINGYNQKRYVTLRVNTLKSNVDEVKKVFDNNDIKYESVSFYKDALVIKNKEEKDIINLNIYKDGKIYLQSLSSMLPPLFLSPNENENILDMTAAPGSKTSQIAALSENKVLITAVEKDKFRCERLKYNMDKLGVKKVNVINIDAQRLDDFYSFDKILLDAPCSGSGTLNEKDFNSFDYSLVIKSVERQTKLINKALKMLKKDGILVYSTCSILKEENENIINEVIKNNDVEILSHNLNLDSIPKLDTLIPNTLCVCPNKYFEGFFVAVLKKKS